MSDDVSDSQNLRDVQIAARRLAGTAEFKVVRSYIASLIDLNLQRCVTSTDMIVVHRSQGAVAELQHLWRTFDATPEVEQKRTHVRREV